MKKIKDISIQEIKEGKNWKAYPSKDPSLSVAEWEIDSSESFDFTDHIAYSAIFVSHKGDVYPLVIVKEVGDLDYGGDSCAYEDGKWKQSGLEPNPNAPNGEEYFADPLIIDPSFDADDDFRKEHQDNFKKWIEKFK